MGHHGKNKSGSQKKKEKKAKIVAAEQELNANDAFGASADLIGEGPTKRKSTAAALTNRQNAAATYEKQGDENVDDFYDEPMPDKQTVTIAHEDTHVEEAAKTFGPPPPTDVFWKTNFGSPLHIISLPAVFSSLSLVFNLLSVTVFTGQRMKQDYIKVLLHTTTRTYYA